jgi:hypothetical protein
MAKRRNPDTNKNAHIVTRIDRTGKIRTETSRRDRGEFDIAVSTDPNSGRTQVFFDRYGREQGFRYGETLRLSGREARTLFIALQRHYDKQGVPALSPAF